MSGGNERRLGLGGTQLMEQRPLGTPEPAPPRAPGTQLIAQTPQQPMPPQAWPPQGPPPQNPEFQAPPVPAYGIPPDAFLQAPMPAPPQNSEFQAPPVPAYGIPPDAFPVPQAPMPHAPPPFDYANAQPLYGGPPPGYAQVQQNYGTFAPKTDHLGPRLKGGAVLLFGLALLGFNAFLIFTQGSFYPKTLILAFPLSWVGFFMVLAGKPVNPSSQHPPAWWMVLCYGGAFFAFVVGIVAAIMITD